MKTVICEIEHYAIHDGPGIRTVVFIKGCPLRCKWCSNPETQRRENELFYSSEKCILCGSCVRACLKNALTKTETGIKINKELCDGCGLCTSACPMSALELAGKIMTVEEVFEEIIKDTIFYRQSGGGVTVSGGEVLMNSGFVLELLKLCRDNYINTAIETSGYGSFVELKKIGLYTNTILFDVKHTDNEMHERFTGVSNKLILENLRKLSTVHGNIILRVPLITNINDSEENIKNTIKLAAECSIKEIHLLPYHSLGADKYRRLQKKYELKDIEKQDKAYIERLKKIVEESGIKCVIGG